MKNKAGAVMKLLKIIKEKKFFTLKTCLSLVFWFVIWVVFGYIIFVGFECVR